MPKIEILCILYIVYFPSIIVLFVSAKNCSITVSGPRPNKPCVFPFEFAHMIYDYCTDEKDPGNFWCSTKVDKDGKHIGGANEWGYCEKDCDGKKPSKVQSSKNKGVGINPHLKTMVQNFILSSFFWHRYLLFVFQIAPLRSPVLTQTINAHSLLN